VNRAAVMGRKPLTVVPYKEAIKRFIPADQFPYDAYPCLVPNWDNTPRSGSRGSVLTGSTPELFRHHAEQGLRFVEKLPDSRRLVFIKSWNEWAEGNYLEPDARWGTAYLEALRSVMYRGQADSAPPSGSLCRADTAVATKDTCQRSGFRDGFRCVERQGLSISEGGRLGDGVRP
jgi:hypothetical protein